MATITSSTLGDLLKRLYASWDIEQLVNLTAPVLGECAAKGSAQLGGSGFYFPVRTESAEGHAYISESQDLPTGQQTTVRQAVVAPVIQAGVVQLSGLSVSVSSGNAMAFAKAFDENVQATIEGMTAYKEGALFRDGTGKLATFVTEPDGVLTTFTMSDVAFFREGMYIDVVDTDLATHHNSDLKVIAVDWVNKTITTDAVVAVGAAAGDFAYIATSQESAVTATSKEPVGFAGSLIATGTYLGLDRAVSGNDNWKANAYAVSGWLDEDVLGRARTRLTQECGIPFSSMAGRFKLLVHPMQVDVLFKLAMPRIQYSGTNNIDLGNSTTVSFGGIPAIASYLCPPAVGYLGDFSASQTFYTPNGELHVDTEYNGSSLKWVATKDVGLVFVKSYHAFAVKAPNRFLRLTSLTELSR